MYNKLFSKILDSSIWLESMPTRIVWLTMLAAMDEDGMVTCASPANLAHKAIVPIADTIEALRVLEGPDANSSDPDHEGRRIERVPGGWIVLNAGKYQALVTRAIARESNRKRVAKHRNKGCNAPVTPCNAPVMVCNGVKRFVTQSDTGSGSGSGSNTNAPSSAHAPEAAELATDPSPTSQPPISASQRWHYEQAQPWAVGIVAAGCKIGPNNWPAWKALIDKHGKQVVLDAAGGVSPDDRWPDKTEKAITMRGTQASSTPQAFAGKTKVTVL
jgi:hypothetical protein